MKKIAVFLLVTVLSCAAAYAQLGIEFNLSAGGPAYMLGSVGGYESGFSAMAEVRYTPNKWVSIGLMGGMHDAQPQSGVYSSEEPVKPCTSSTYEYNLMLMLYGNWYTGDRFRVYSGVGYGTMAGYTDGDGRPAHGVQIVPAGISFGRRFFGFAELGMGWMYCPSRAGIGFRF